MAMAWLHPNSFIKRCLSHEASSCTKRTVISLNFGTLFIGTSTEVDAFMILAEAKTICIESVSLCK